MSKGPTCLKQATKLPNLSVYDTNKIIFGTVLFSVEVMYVGVKRGLVWSGSSQMRSGESQESGQKPVRNSAAFVSDQ
jgi:hypothetical protein